MTVPESAVVTRYLVPSVFVVENGKAVSKTVKIVQRSGGKVLIEGLLAGVKIITDGKDRVTEGEKVE